MRPALLAAGALTAGAVLAGSAPAAAGTDGTDGTAGTPTATATDRQTTAASSQSEQLTFARLQGSGGTFTSADGELQDVEMTARDVTIAGSRVTLGQVVLDGVVPFADVSEQAGDDVRLEAADDGRVRVIRTVGVLGREVNVSGTGDVEVVDGRVVVEPATVDVGGPGWIEGFLGRTAGRLVTVEEEVPGLPPGLSLQDVEVGERGFEVRLTGEDVVFSD